MDAIGLPGWCEIGGLALFGTLWVLAMVGAVINDPDDDDDVPDTDIYPPDSGDPVGELVTLTLAD